MKDVGMFNGHLVYFTAIGYTLWTLGVLCGNLVYFSPFWYVVLRKIWQPWLHVPLHVHSSQLQILKITFHEIALAILLSRSSLGIGSMID
jgi:hypothetical protein